MHTSAKKVKKSVSWGQRIVFLFLCIYTIIQLYPMVWLIFFSLKNNKQIFGGNALGLPDPAVFENYVVAFENAKIGTYLVNSVIVTGCTILIVIVLTTMGAYAITRLKWKYSNLFLLFITTGMMIPVHAALLPLFISFSRVGILNTRIALILPYVGFALGLSTNIMALFFKTIPDELEEAAVIDGCGIGKTFLFVMLPMVKPAIVTVAIFTYLDAWNELMFANTFINKAALKTLTVGIMSLVGEYATSWGPIGAGLVIATIPSIICYSLVSKRLPDAISSGAVKG
ncbi:Inner membrane ABC transporter permease protein ycjP [uncultured Clostridium sp.]|uniref:carbohydrate ABC transporter permease n=1 Tax=Clostridia TaxID=186801 RepID=UPI00061FBD3C|nr:trehalose transport system permease protein SugB [Clostridium sp. FS41]SCH25048.1 Inner membrane ABC transporter permease protein ycjP [uncultured Clostridium sp.]